MNEKKMFDMVIELCKAVGLSIDRISKECNVHQDHVAMLFMKVMQKILDGMKR